MPHPRRAPIESEKNWLYTVYAAVLLKALEDVSEPSRKSDHISAVKWFAEEPVEVAIVCSILRFGPLVPPPLKSDIQMLQFVYREVAKRLRAHRIRCRQISLIRWRLRRGEVKVSLETDASDEWTGRVVWTMRSPTETLAIAA